MTETQKLSIEEVRALVAERQRYDDWLAALDARRAETPERVFERVRADYSGRRKDVGLRLRSHIGELSAMAGDLDARLGSLEGTLGTLEDERAEAMLRTAVGEFDGEQWEQVRQSVEAQIAQLGEQRAALATESGEVKTLLESARAANDDAEVVLETVPVDVASVTEAEPAADEPASDDTPIRDVMTGESLVGHSVSVELLTTDTLVESPLDIPVERSLDLSQPTDDELADLDNALSMFSNDAPTTSYVQTMPTPRSLNGVDVFDDADLGDLRMDPPVKAAAVATPPSAPAVDRNHPTSAKLIDGANTTSTSRDGGFDDLAFLRSVVEPSDSAGANRTSSSSELKTLRCTECGTMNLPTEWYCERCGGELAAF
jgi:hypothetical protein